jgi:hypothetical protein
MSVVSCLAMLCQMVSLTITIALEDSNSVDYDFASLGESRRFEGPSSFLLQGLKSARKILDGLVLPSSE